MPQVDFNNHETGKHAALRGTLPCFWLYQVLLGNSRSTNSLLGKDLAMKATWLYRIAAVLFILFAAGHTFGFLSFRPHSREGVAVFDAMNKVSFQEKGATHSYGRFYRGFGLSYRGFGLSCRFLAWHLGSLAGKLPQAIGALGWIFFAVQLAGVWLSWKYFGPPPVVFSATVAICLGWAAWLVSSLQI